MAWSDILQPSLSMSTLKPFGSRDGFPQIAARARRFGTAACAGVRASQGVSGWAAVLTNLAEQYGRVDLA
jgi:hypothetical protein